MIKFYKCSICGKVIAVIEETEAETFCCGQEMFELKAGAVDGAKEKHVPVVKRSGNRISVQIGSIKHPMEEKHYISFIALETTSGMQIKKLTHTDVPEVIFYVGTDEKILSVFAYCNIHGLWKTEL